MFGQHSKTPNSNMPRSLSRCHGLDILKLNTLMLFSNYFWKHTHVQ